MDYQLVAFNYSPDLLITGGLYFVSLITVILLFNFILRNKNHWWRLVLFGISSFIIGTLFFNKQIKSRVVYENIDNLEIVKIEDNLFLFSFTTDQAKKISLLYSADGKIFSQIDPTSTLREQLNHNFIVEMNDKKGDLIFLINDLKYFVNWQSLKINY